MHIFSFVSGNTNCYLLKSEKSILLIDAGVSTDKNFIKKLSAFVNPYEIDFLILTHGHYDHVGNAWLLQQKYGVKILMHKLDVPMVQKRERSEDRFFSSLFTLWQKGRHFSPFEPDFVMEGQYTEMSHPEIIIVHLPGHTAGSIGVIWNRNFFAGDLFSEKMKQEKEKEEVLKSIEWIKKFRGIDYCYLGQGERFCFQKIQKQEKIAMKQVC